VAEEFDSVAKELDLVFVHLNFTMTELVPADAVLIRRSAYASYNLNISRLDYKYYPVISGLTDVLSAVLTFARQIFRRLRLSC
jgi:hypothetical protein